MAKKAKADKNFIIRCSHCFEDDFKLEDIKLEDKVKYYTDSPIKATKTSQGLPPDETMVALKPTDNTQQDLSQI